MASQPQDGCPRGSKDFRLSVDSNRIDHTRVIAAPAPMLCVTAAVAEISRPLTLRPSFPGFLIVREAQHSAIVLRC